MLLPSVCFRRVSGSPYSTLNFLGRQENKIGLAFLCCVINYHLMIGGLPSDSDGKESTCNAGNVGSIPGLGRPMEKEMANPLQYSCLENSMDRAAWWATVHGVAKSQSNSTHTWWPNTVCIYQFTISVSQTSRHNLTEYSAQGLRKLQSRCWPDCVLI